MYYSPEFSLLVPTPRQPLGSHRATGGVLPTFNSVCEAHEGRRIKRYRPDYRGTIFLSDDTKYLSVNIMCEK